MSNGVVATQTNGKAADIVEAKVADGTLVYYHGSWHEYYGFAQASADDKGTYSLMLIGGTHDGKHIYCVERANITVVPVPDYTPAENTFQPGYFAMVIGRYGRVVDHPIPAWYNSEPPMPEGQQEFRRCTLLIEGYDDQPEEDHG